MMRWLLMPMPGQPLEPCRCEPRHRTAATSGRRTATISDWDRWVLAHHMSFMIWRLIAESIRQSLQDQTASARSLVQAADLFNAYTGLLLYGASCSPAHYAAVIRPRMAAAHPAFSGTWARDFEQVTALLRQSPPPAGSELRGAVHLNRIVHRLIAKRLVPEGASLLRESGHVRDAVTDEDRDLFDRVFLTTRQSVCRERFASQLSHRARVVADDVARRPLRIDYDWPGIDTVQDAMPDYMERLRWSADEFAASAVNNAAGQPPVTLAGADA